MKTIFSTFAVLFRQSLIELNMIILMTVILNGIVIYKSMFAEGTQQILMMSGTTSYILSAFWAVHLASGLLRLKRSHLWCIHSGYRYTLIRSFLLATTVIGIIQFTPMVLAGWPWYVALLAPICSTILTAQVIMGKNILMKTVLCAAPILIFLLSKWHISQEILLLLAIIVTLLALISMATDLTYLTTNNSVMFDLVGGRKQRLNNRATKKANNFTVRLITNFVPTVQAKNLAVALFHPVSRYNLAHIPFIITLAIIGSFFQGTEENPIVMFGVMMLTTMLLQVFIDIQALARQTANISHLFVADRQSIFKQKIVTMVDKHIIFSALFFISMMLFSSLFVNFLFDLELFIRTIITVALIAAALQPAFLCLDWYKVKVSLLIMMTLYGLLIFVLNRWHMQHEFIDLLSTEVLAASLILIVIRLSASRFWKRQPLEKFMRVYG